MTGVKIITTSICLITSCAGLAFLGSATLPAAPQQSPSARTSAPSRRSKTTKHTWHTGPASTPPETEFIPASPPPAPPLASTNIHYHAMREKSAAVDPRVAPPGLSLRATTATASGSLEHTSKANADRPDYSNSPNPEAQRIQDEFARLRQDAVARRAFYDDLLGTVERVRAGMRDESSAEEKFVSFKPAAHPSGKPSIEPDNPPQLPEFNKPQEPPPGRPPAPQSSLGPYGNRFDQVAYQRVVRWAKANGAPVSLALGVAWMESHLNTHAPRGSAGEVGMFQIMPGRCRLEGWSPKRLSEPEFNAWMGTMLLARYYQEEGSVARAAAKYVAGPGVFNKEYSKNMWTYINWYATTVDSYASYFSRDQS